MIDTKRIGIIGAHAMDAELMGGAAAYFFNKQGWESFFIHITRGERGNPGKTQAVFGKQLEEEMQICAKKLHANSIWAGFAAGAVPMLECSNYLEQTIIDLKLDIVITHWKGSFHPRHRITHDCVLNALKQADEHGYKVDGLYYGENMEDLDGFIPSLYLDISEIYEIWFDAMKSYELFRSSPNKFPYQAFYSANSALRGLESGCTYAKCFMLQKSKLLSFNSNFQPVLG